MTDMATTPPIDKAAIRGALERTHDAYRELISQIPDGKWDATSSNRAFTCGQLAWHIASGLDFSAGLIEAARTRRDRTASHLLRAAGRRRSPHADALSFRLRSGRALLPRGRVRLLGRPWVRAYHGALDHRHPLSLRGFDDGRTLSASGRRLAVRTRAFGECDLSLGRAHRSDVKPIVSVLCGQFRRVPRQCHLELRLPTIGLAFEAQVHVRADLHVHGVASRLDEQGTLAQTLGNVDQLVSCLVRGTASFEFEFPSFVVLVSHCCLLSCPSRRRWTTEPLPRFEHGFWVRR